jgi:hypothetical protein
MTQKRKQPINLGASLQRREAPAVPQRGAADDRVALTVRVDQRTYERLAIAAARRRLKHQAVLEEALERWLAEAES